MNNTFPEAQQAIDQLRRSFVDSCAPVMEQFQLDQQVLRAEAAVKQQYCMMHSLSPDESLFPVLRMNMVFVLSPSPKGHPRKWLA